MEFYEPREDSVMLLRWVKKLAKGKVLDMGTGSGIQAIGASENAVKVVAVDINIKALKSAKDWAKEKSVTNISFKKSNLFSDITGKFDVIIFNAPYLPEEGGIEDSETMGKKTTLKFIKEAYKYLKKNGFILIVVSSFTGIKDVRKAAERYKIKVLEKQHIFFEDIYILKLEKKVFYMSKL
jgi:release factor glutamine methyltransferase